jgi:hypothetical protein
MRMPIQSSPIARGISSGPTQGELVASDIVCDLCQLGCNELSGLAKAACLLLCENTVC